jgi:hypothetical protein
MHRKAFDESLALVDRGTNPARLDCYDAYADFFEYFPEEQRMKFDGAVSPLYPTTPSPTIALPILFSLSQ